MATATPKYLFRPSDIPDDELEAFAEWFVDQVLDNAARDPLLCPAGDGV